MWQNPPHRLDSMLNQSRLAIFAFHRRKERSLVRKIASLVLLSACGITGSEGLFVTERDHGVDAGGTAPSVNGYDLTCRFPLNSALGRHQCPQLPARSHSITESRYARIAQRSFGRRS